MLDLPSSIPTFIHITDGKTHEVYVLDDLVIEAKGLYLMDRSYLDFARRHNIHQAKAFFVTRAKSSTQLRRRYSNPVDRSTTSVICDQIGVLTVYYSSKDYPSALRRVVVKDETGKPITFSDKRLRLEARTDCRPVPPALEGGVVFQMDQTAFAHRGASGQLVLL